MKLAIRCALLLAILAIASTAAEGQGALFGRPGHTAAPGFTIFMGATDKAHLKSRGVELASNVLIAFPDSSIVITADGARWVDGAIELKGNARIKIDTDAKALMERINGESNWDAPKIELP